MTWTICFDFPEVNDPVFAAKGPHGLGWTAHLSNALRCETFEEADRWLQNGYGETRKFGTVVEVAE